jgi:hypothetical protein
VDDGVPGNLLSGSSGILGGNSSATNLNDALLDDEDDDLL